MRGAEVHGLVVQHPVRHILKTGRAEPVDGLVGLGERGREPALRRLACEALDTVKDAVNHVALVRDSRQGLLYFSMADSIPPCSHTGVDYMWIDIADRRVHDE